ncbi:MAG: LysR family transcriptional regulator [Myxococcales bacterium]|nr:LysR family transcriptional regulator [Myxococcales bacterium]
MRTSISIDKLRILDALLSAKAVAKAARKLKLSQPAVSHVLAELRAHFDDELLVRVGGTFALTPFAEGLVDSLQLLLREFDAFLATHSPFVPSAAKGRLRLATSDHVEFVLLPGLVRAIGAVAEGIALDVSAVSAETLAEVASGAVHVAIGPFSDAPPSLQSRLLFEEPFVCIVRRGHPARTTLDLERFASLSHVLVAPRGAGGGAVDEALTARGLRRRIHLTVPHFFAAAPLVEGSDAIATLPVSVARHAAELHAVEVVAPPLSLPPIRMRALWSERLDRDPLQRWFRSVVFEVAGRSTLRSAQ